MKKIKINISKESILQGVQKDNSKCPLAIECLKQLPKGMWTIDMAHSPEAHAFVQEFDSRGTLCEPRTVEVSYVEGLVFCGNGYNRN